MPNTLDFNFQYDLSQIVLWQYQDAPNFNALVADQQEFLDTAITEFWNSVKDDIFNLQTCNSDGLAMWGQLLQTPRPTYNNEGAIVPFTDEQYRRLLQARIYTLTFDGSVASLNKFFKIVFPDLNVQITDNYNMTVTIYIADELTPEVAVLFSNDFVNNFLPRPSGVQYIIDRERDYTKIFGFDGMHDKDGNSVAGFGTKGNDYNPATDPGGTFYE